MTKLVVIVSFNELVLNKVDTFFPRHLFYFKKNGLQKRTVEDGIGIS